MAPSGPMDASVAPGLRDQAAAWWDANPALRHIVVDLGAVSFIDSAGLGVLIGLLKRVAARGGDVRLARPQSAVRLVLEITRVTRVFTIFPTVEEASA